MFGWLRRICDYPKFRVTFTHEYDYDTGSRQVVYELNYQPHIFALWHYLGRYPTVQAVNEQIVKARKDLHEIRTH